MQQRNKKMIDNDVKWELRKVFVSHPPVAAFAFHSLICIAGVGLFGSQYFSTIVCFAPWESKKLMFVYSYLGSDKMIFLKINITYQVFKIFLCELLCSSQIFAWHLWRSECAKFMLGFISIISSTGIFKSNLVKFSSCCDSASALEEH